MQVKFLGQYKDEWKQYALPLVTSSLIFLECWYKSEERERRILYFIQYDGLILVSLSRIFVFEHEINKELTTKKR